MSFPIYTQYAYTQFSKAVFVELPAFDRHRAEYLDDDGLRALQDLLMRNPTAGLPIPETGGWWEPGPEFWLFTLFDKDEMADLSPQDRRALKTMVKAELEAKRTA